MQVRDVMTSNPIVTSPSATLGEAAEVMLENGFRHLPVVEGGALVGMISDRDVQTLMSSRVPDRDALERMRTRYEASVSEVMVPDVETIDPETTVKDSIDKLLEAKVGALPVVDPSTGELQGILSYVDVLRALRDDG